MLLFIHVVFLENEPLSCLEWLSELRTTTEQQQIVKIEYFTRPPFGLVKELPKGQAASDNCKWCSFRNTSSVIRIPQGSVLGPTLFSMFTNDLPTCVVSGSVYMFADDTTIYCIGTSADEATAQLNLAMHELYSWCLANKLKPHPGKSEGYFSQRELWPYFMGCLLQLR